MGSTTEYCGMSVRLSWISVAFVGALVCAAAGRANAASAPGFGVPYVPAQDGEVIQEVPARTEPAVQRMHVLRAAWSAAPQDLGAALGLAEAYVDYGREIGDAHYAGYAEAVIAPWVHHVAPPANALVLQATILQFRHQFADARDFLRAAFKADPRNAQAWITLATLDMVQGDYAAAGKDCAQVTSFAGLALGLACGGSLRSYIGHAEQSQALLHQAAASLGGASAPTRAWLSGLMAETAERLGDWSAVESRYRDALLATPQDNFLLVAYADFLLDRGRPQEVLTLLKGHEQSDTAFLRIVLAQAAVHSADLANSVWIMAARFDALAQRGSDYFGREQSRFALQLQHDPARALDLALQNWRVQRAPWDARVLLEAALAARQPAAAAPALQFLEQTHLQDPVIEPLAQQLRTEINKGVHL
jgi:Tfp pilus assembly protein PilF